MSKGDPSKDQELAAKVRQAVKEFNKVLGEAQKNGLYVEVEEKGNKLIVSRITRSV